MNKDRVHDMIVDILGIEHIENKDILSEYSDNIEWLMNTPKEDLKISDWEEYKAEMYGRFDEAFIGKIVDRIMEKYYICELEDGLSISGVCEEGKLCWN